jgi:hypothetical protein
MLAAPLPAMSATADELPAAWWDTDKPNCQVWNAHPYPNEIVTWSGSCRNGKADGRGKVVFSHVDESGETQAQAFDANLDLGKEKIWSETDRSNCLVRIPGRGTRDVTWSGNCEAGKADGRGRLAWSSSSLEDGERIDNVFEGTIRSGDDLQGVLTASNGFRLEGRILKGGGEGHVLRIDKNGNRFEGEYKAGKRNGFGIATDADGFRYEGQYKDGKWDGRGILRTANGGRYEGEFKAGKYEGHGVLNYADGARYEGEFKDSEKSGHGILVLSDGARYEGEFKEGKYHGHGIYLFTDGTRYDGQFENDLFRGQGKMTYPDGSSYRGNFRDDKGHGIGECRAADGTSGRCEYSNGDFVRWLD